MIATFMLCALALPWVGEAIGGAPDPVEMERARASVIRGAVASAESSIVTIETMGGAQPLAESPADTLGPRRGPRRSGPVRERFQIAEGPTTGLIVSPDGLIITSSFNFARDPAVITVTLADGSRHVGKRLGVDYIRRLALVRINASNLPTCGWAPYDDLRVGQYAIACGRGLDARHAAPSFGIVSALGRRNGNAIQTDAKTSPVNYGGPLIDIEGQVMGVIVPMAGAGGALAGAAWYDSGIGFAVPKYKIDFVLDRLIAGEIIEPGKIGVILETDEPGVMPFLDDLFDWSKGVKIREVARTSPAARAKMRGGDRILALDGHPISDLPELQRRLSDRAAGENVTLTIKRRWRKSFDVEITLARAVEIRGLGNEPPPVSTEADTPENEDDFPATQPASD